MTHDGSARLPRGATLRAVLVGVVLCITNAYWLAYTSEMMEPVSLLTFLSLFINAVFTLFALVVANAAFARWAPRLALTSQEVLVVYLMVVMVSTIGGHTTMTFLIGIITHPVQFASAENDWTALFGRFIPPWFLPPVEALDAYYKGETTLYLAERLRAWARPVLVWTGFIAVLWYAFLSLCAILQEQWTEREKLVFPITRLPLEMAGVSAGRFWTSRGMWAGFAVAGGIELFAGLRVVFPSVPALRIKGYEMDGLFTTSPWNEIGWVPITAFPFIIGLTYFVPLHLSFSAWVFYVLRKVERVARLGVMGASDLHFRERESGAWLAIGVLALWGTRRHLASVARSLLTAPVEGRQRQRAAVVGLAVSLSLASAFLLQAGMSLPVVAWFMGLSLVIGVGVSRIRAELGPPSHEIFAFDPARVMMTVVGSGRLGGANLTVMSFTFWLNRLNIAHPMPNQMEAFKIAERARIPRGRLVGALMLATVVGSVASFWAYLHLMYEAGADSVPGYIVGIGYETFGQRLERWLLTDTAPTPEGINALMLGAAITGGLYMLRHRFVGWPLHPIGYAMTAGTFGGLSDFWSSVFLGWAVKAAILRFFGFGAFRAGMPFFLGLVLGDYVVACLWSLTGMLLGVPTYALWP